MPQGRVKWFNVRKGYGFITMMDGMDVFVHRSAVPEEEIEALDEGVDVEFEVEEGPKGKQAVNVRRIL